MMEQCVTVVECNPYMECDGSVQIVTTLTCAQRVTMETNTICGIGFTEYQSLVENG